MDESNGDGSFNRIRGEDSWLGRQVRKKFWVGKGHNRRLKLFYGTVTAIDDDEDNPGHRLFEITYEDGDDECMDPCNTHAILHNSERPVRCV